MSAMIWMKCATFVAIIYTVAAITDKSNKELKRTRHEQRKQKRFGFPGGSSGGGMGGGSPFHTSGGPGRGSGMPNMSPMGGSMSHGPMSSPSMNGGGMQGPHPPGGSGMGMAMGGPSSPGHTSMFNPSKCLRQIRCPQWCLMIDEFGCHSCPCGPGGGMFAMSGGMGTFMSGMPSMGGSSFSHVSQQTHSKNDCIGVELCKSTCQGQYTIGPIGSDGCPSCKCQSQTVETVSSGGSYSGEGGSSSGGSGGVGGGSGGGGFGGSGGGSSVSGGGGGGMSGGFSPFTIPSGGSSSQTSTGSTGSTSGQTSYVVAPAKECRTEEVCRETCGSNYEIGKAGSDGCGTCICIKPAVTYTQQTTEVKSSTEIQQIITLTCPSLSCSYGCSVGYKCGEDGCPTCECALPSGYSTHEVVIQHKVDYCSSFSCANSCEIGYRCDRNGCPTCECLVGYVQPQTTGECYDCEYIDFLTPTPTPETVYVQPQITYVQPRPQKTVYVTNTHECTDCETVKPQMVSYVRPRPQQTVYVTEKHNECTDCETVQPQMVSYVRPRPQQTQTVYVTEKHQECTDCGKTEVVYKQPKPQTVYVTGTQTQTECHDCGSSQTVYVEKQRPQTVYVEKPRPQTVYVEKPRPQTETVLVTKPETHSGCSGGSGCGSTHTYTTGGSSGVIMSVLTGSGHSGGSNSGHSSGGGGSYFIHTGGGGAQIGGHGGIPYGIAGGSHGGISGSVIGMSGAGSAHCPPMRHDCHPACIKYDEPHCRRCLC